MDPHAPTPDARRRHGRVRLHGGRPLPGLAHRTPLLRPAAPPRMRALCGRDAGPRGRGGRDGSAGSRPRPTGRGCWTATTSTSSTSALPATRTPRSPSRRSRPASTCSARSRSPTRSPRPRRWPQAAERAAEHGVRSMVGFTYRRVPADRAGPPAGRAGPASARSGTCGRSTSRTGSPTRGRR